MATILSSCGTLEKLLHDAASQKGKAQAGVHIPDQPADCRKTVPYAARKVGDEAVSVIDRSDRQLDKANARILRCAADRDNVKKKLEGAAP
jgi:hypothetical protein